MPQWSVIIPAFNEAERLPDTLLHLAKNFPRFGSFEVIVVDDGSTDQTSEVARRFGPHFPCPLRVLRLSENKGKGAAVRLGISQATGKWILVTDADNAIPCENLEHFLPFQEKYPLIIGSKYLQQLPERSLSRSLMAKSANRLVRLLFKLAFTDTQAGFKVIRADVAKDLFAQMQVNRWAYDVELLALAMASNCPIREVAVTWDPTSTHSQVRFIPASLTSLSEILGIKTRMLCGRYSFHAHSSRQS